MSDCDSRYDPKYGYNRNAFAHKTLGMAVMGRVVKLIATPIPLSVSGSTVLLLLLSCPKSQISKSQNRAPDAPKRSLASLLSLAFTL